MKYDFYWNYCVFLFFYEGYKSVKYIDIYSKYYLIISGWRFLI